MEKNPSNNNIRNGHQFVRGWSWGDMKISQNKIAFENSGHPWFSIPFSGISNALLPTKNEIGLEFNADEENDAR